MPKSKNKYQPYVYARAEQLGIPVVEAKLPIRVHVSDEDVILAKKKDSKHCALARAAARVPNVKAAYIFRSRAFLEYPDRIVRFLLPQSTQREIISFDRANIFASGVYQLSAVGPATTLKGGSDYRKEAKKRKSKVKVDRKAKINDSISKVVAQEIATYTPEQKAFEEKMAKLVESQKKHAGGRTVTGVRNGAVDPLPITSPGKKYLHRTQYIRDLTEPAD